MLKEILINILSFFLIIVILFLIGYFGFDYFSEIISVKLKAFIGGVLFG